MKFELSTCKNILVWGAGHGIGLALVRDALHKAPRSKIYATFRIEKNAEDLFRLKEEFNDRIELIHIDPSNEAAIMDLSIEYKSKKIEFDLILNSIGLLHSEAIEPEKSLRTVSLAQFMESFKVNTVVTAIIAKNFEKLIPKKAPSAFVSLSAKVGSIEDNKMGGWYSYRASKAALNMILKTISIEFKRKRMNCLVLSIHPGTTKTELSRPYTKNTKYKLHSPAESAHNILWQIEGRAIEESGSFITWEGESLAW